MNLGIKPAVAKNLLEAKLSHFFGVKPQDASDDFFYKAAAMVLNDLMLGEAGRINAKAESLSKKRVYYLCMEFLLGRSLKNNLYNLGLEDVFREALSGFSVKLDRLYELEPDAGLGNGGLGRLAACYLDGLSSGGYPAMGYSICYEFGIFRQKLVDGWQTELPDFWLPGGEVWFVPRPEEEVTVRFDGEIREIWDGNYHHIEQIHTSAVTAVPYDMMIPGHHGEAVNTLRLWSAKAPGLDMKLFNDGNYLLAMEQNAMAEAISKILYPADNHPEGKSLRLRQQYFLVSASVQDMVKRHLRQYGTMDNFHEKAAIQLNDTHPALCVPELMRILLDDCGYSWDFAWNITRLCLGYTNHTVMSEALECWSLDLFKTRLPRITQIVTEINNRFRNQMWNQTHNAEMVERTAVISGQVIRMANLCIAAAHHVNGVSRLHSDILKKA